jgi:hypothetical protein
MKPLLFFLFLLLEISCIGQNQYYKSAYAEQVQMLKGEKNIDFKRAVFLTENAYHKGKLDYTTFCNDIKSIGTQLKELIKNKGLDTYKTAGNWATFTYMTESAPINQNRPYTYDFEDFMGEKDATKMFVTKLMKTHSGNCHSLPYFYKILCEEIGANASLTLAPNHIYIKHIDEKGQWTNVELTNPGFPRDQWIIKQMNISVESLKNETYMKALSPKESVALCMFDLAMAYKAQYGYDDFALQVANTAIMYFPKCVPLLMFKANCLDSIIKTKRKANVPEKEILAKITLYKKTLSQIDGTGHKDMPKEMYEEWVTSMEKAKAQAKK